MESGDVTGDQSEQGEGTSGIIAEKEEREREGEGEGVRVRRGSRPATADRKSLKWEEVGGDREGEEREEREGVKMRRLSLTTAEGSGSGVRQKNSQCFALQKQGPNFLHTVTGNTLFRVIICPVLMPTFVLKVRKV